MKMSVSFLCCGFRIFSVTARVSYDMRRPGTSGNCLASSKYTLYDGGRLSLLKLFSQLQILKPGNALCVNISLATSLGEQVRKNANTFPTSVAAKLMMLRFSISGGMQSGKSYSMSVVVGSGIVKVMDKRC